MKWFLSISLLCFVAVGCATGYHKNGFTGGFNETRLAPDVFRITFRGNGYTSGERAQDFVLLRASELVLQNGFTCFAVIDSQQSSTPFVYSTPATANTTTYGSGYTSGTVYGNSYSGNTSLYAHSTTTYNPGQTFVFYKPSSGLMVRAFQDKPDNIQTFDAVFLRDQICSHYKIKLANSDSIPPKVQAEPNKSSINPDEGKYVLWKDFAGTQKNWPTAEQSFVSKIEGLPVYDRGQFPSNPYIVIGQIESATMLGVEPMDQVLKEAVDF